VNSYFCFVLNTSQVDDVFLRRQINSRHPAFGAAAWILCSSLADQEARIESVWRETDEEISKRGLRSPFWTMALLALALFFALGSPHALNARPASDDIEDITGKYHFLSADDTLAILEEDGKLKGYIDVYQSEEESDAVLSYPITLGRRKKDHVEFKSGTIHRKYYRFAGTVERGPGHEAADPDYLRLVGDLEIVTLRGDTGAEAVDRRRVILKSLGKNEESE